MDQGFDLLGDPIPEGWGKRGRPPHLPTGENRNKVRMLLAFDWEQERIAKALRITGKTLRKHYSRELGLADEARPKLEAELMFVTIREALAGNASMMKEARKLLEKHDLAELAESVKERGAKAPKLGKKEERQQAALDVDGKFAPPPPPPRLVN